MKSIGAIVLGVVALTASALFISELIYDEDLAAVQKWFLLLPISLFALVGIKFVMLGISSRKQTRG